jgi:membrane-associated protein
MHASLVHHILAVTGVAGIWLTLFCETGLFFGFLLPGGSLLFVGGVLASQNQLSLAELVIGSMLAVFIGYQVGYWFGEKFGYWLHNKKDSWYFKQAHLKKAYDFYQKYGFVAIMVGRFVPVVRTFVPIIAGIAEMPKKTFLMANLIGSVIWVIFFVLLGYFLGHRYHNLTHLIMPILVGIIVLTLIPIIVIWFKEQNK